MNTNWILSEPAYGSLAQLADLFLAGLLVLAAAGVLTGFMRRMPAAARHIVWAMALTLLLLLPVMGNWTPQVRLGMLERPAWMESSERTIENTWSDVAALKPPMQPNGLTATTEPRFSEQRQVAGTESAVVAATGGVSENTIAVNTSNIWVVRAFAPFITMMRQAHWSIWMLSIWGLGVALIVGWSLSGFAGVWWITRHAHPVEDESWHDLLDELADRLLIYQSVQLLVSPRIVSPMTWGVIRPVVLLPVDADDWSEDRRRSVLLHELAHVKRGDSLIQFVAQLGCALHWFNPMAWHALKKMRMEQEKACDDLVLVNGTRASEYASHLLAIARSIKSSWASPLNTVSMAKPSLLEGRVVDILDPDRKERRLSMANGIGTSVLALVIMLPLAALTPWQESESRDAFTPSLATLPQAEATSAWAASAASPAPVILADPTPEVRENAAERPVAPVEREQPFAIADTSEEGKRARAKAIRALREALNDEDADMRKNAAIMLAEMGDKGSVDTFIKLLKSDPDAEVRRHALFGLGDIRSEKVTHAVIEALEDENKDVRRHAVMLIADHRHPEATGALLKLIDDNDPDIRRTAVMGLANRGGENVAEALLDVLDDPDADVRRSAIMGLAEFRSEAALPAIIKALEDTNADVRRFAVMALTEYQENEQIVSALRKSLKDPNAEVRRHALMAIGEFRDIESLDVLLEVLENDENADMRKHAAMVLGEIGDIKAVDALTSALKDENKEVRRHAAFALSNLDYDDRRGSFNRDDEFDASVLELEKSARSFGLAVGELSVGLATGVIANLAGNFENLEIWPRLSDEERIGLMEEMAASIEEEQQLSRAGELEVLVKLSKEFPDGEICDYTVKLLEEEGNNQMRKALKELKCIED